MAIATTASIEYRPESGWEDPGYPIRVWRAGATVTGNATGGTRVVQINLKAANVQPGNLFSLEYLSVENGAIGDDAVSLLTSGMELLSAIAAVRHWSIPTPLVDGTTDLAMSLVTMPKLFIGRAAGFTSAGTLAFSVSNADTERLEINAMGYMWGPRSVSQSRGGPRRPPDGMFPQ